MLLKITASLLNKYSIFFWNKNSKILLFLVKHYTIKTDIIGYYL